MNMVQWRCLVRWPPGHRWKRVTTDEITITVCARCGKEHNRPSPPAPDGEEMIRKYAAGQHF